MPIAIAVTIVEAIATSAVGKRIMMAGNKLSIAKSIPPATTQAATTVGNFNINLTGEFFESSSIAGSNFFIKKKGTAVTMSTNDTQKNGNIDVCPNNQIIAGPPAKPSDIETAYMQWLLVEFLEVIFLSAKLPTTPNVSQVPDPL